MVKDIKTICAEKLIVISANITPADKAKIIAMLPISRTTLDNYLKGDIAKIETATKLIQLFNIAVNKRLKELTEVA